MADEIVHLSIEEALYCIGDKEYIHTFINAPFGLIGADWGKDEVIEHLQNAEDIQIGGEVCRAMNHGIVVFPKRAKKQSDLYFIECDDKKLSEIEQKKEVNGNDI